MQKNKNAANAAKKSPDSSEQAESTKGLSFIDYVQVDLAELNIKIDSDTRTFHGVSGKSLTTETVATDIEANRDTQEKPGIGRQRIVNALERLLEYEQELVFVETVSAVAFDSTVRDQFDELAGIICGPECNDDEKKFVPLLLRHVLWSMKRRLNGHRVDNPLLLNIYGQAHCGKSKFLELLLSPLPRTLWFACAHGDSLMNDERWVRTFGDFYGIVLDELGGMKKADLAKLKNSIDSPFLTYRVMRTNSVSKVRNTAQLLGTSNSRLRDTFAADDNVRKYAEIDFVSYATMDEQKSKVWDRLNEFDWMSLWRSVDENQDLSPMFEDWEQFVIWTSNKCVRQTLANIWWSQFLDEHEGETIAASEIQRSLDHYYEKHQVEKQFRKGKNALAKLLDSGGCQRDRSSGKGTFYVLPFKNRSRIYIPDRDEEQPEISSPRGIKEIFDEARRAA